MQAKNLRWYAALGIVTAAFVASVLFAGNWSSRDASADVQAGQVQTGGWALVNLHISQVIAVYPDSFDRQDLYENHAALRLVKIPDDVTVEATNTAYIDGVFVSRPWGWWLPTPVPTITPAPSATGTMPAPTSTSTPTPAPAPTATPVTAGPTLEDALAMISALEIQLADHESRLATAEAEIAILKGP